MHKVIDEPNKDNKELLQMTKIFRGNLLFDVSIKIGGLIITIIIYAPAMMFSVLMAAVYITLVGFIEALNSRKNSTRK